MNTPDTESWKRGSGMEVFFEKLSQKDKLRLTSVFNQTRQEAILDGRKEACDYIYDKLNDYLASPSNPDYELPSCEELSNFIEEARTLPVTE